MPEAVTWLVQKTHISILISKPRKNETFAYTQIIDKSFEASNVERKTARYDKELANMEISRILDDYRQHTILSAKHKGKFRGRVWKEKALLHETEGKSVEHTLGELKQFVDKKLEGAARAAGSTPDESRVTESLREICSELSEGQLAMLKAHYHAQNQVITTSELAAAAGYSSDHPANLHYGNIGKMLYELQPVELKTNRDGTPIYTYYLATELTDNEDEQRWHWKLRPEVSNAIRALGLDA